MPTDIFEDGLDIHIGLLEADSVERNDAYPFPRLRPTGHGELRRFRTVILESPYLRVTLVPALGGRILSIFDRRTEIEVLPPSQKLEIAQGGRRGVTIREGIQLRLDGEDRLNSLGNVALQIEDAPDEDSVGGVWMAESAMANGLSFHLGIFLPPDRAEIRLEARILNRTFAPISYNGEIAIFLGEGNWDGTSFYAPGRDSGIFVESDDFFDGVAFEAGVLRVRRFSRFRDLAPRQVDHWTLSLVPITGLGGLSFANKEIAGHIASESVRFQTSRLRMDHKIVVLTADGQTLESPVDLYPEHVFEVPRSAFPSLPEAFAVIDPRKNEIFRLAKVDPIEVYRDPDFTQTPFEIPWKIGLDSTPEELKRATFDVRERHVAYTVTGINRLAKKELESADQSFDQALSFNAEDPLLWWAKALVFRQQGGEEENSSLLNAHFLAPLEPALRAEAFLSQSMAMTKEPSPLVELLNENAEEFVEVAALLIEHGQLDQANRWIDEALRHRDLAMLRVLMAYCLLLGTRMIADAAGHLEAAKKVAGAPYPWRDIEVRAIRTLLDRFPGDEYLTSLLAIAGG